MMITRPIRTIRAKLIIGVLATLLFVFAVLFYACYDILAPQLIKEQLDVQVRYAMILCRAIQSWKTEMEGLSIQLTVNDELQNYLLTNAQERGAQAQNLSRLLYQFKNDHEQIENIYLVDKSYNMIGTSSIKDVRPYVLDRISSVERAAGTAAWDSGFDTNGMMLCRAVNDVRFRPNTSIGYLFISFENENILALFNQYRLHDDQHFSLKGQIDGFEVTEQGFFYNYYDNYADLIHVEVTMSPWYLRTWSSKSVALKATSAMLQQIVMILGFAFVFACLFYVVITRQITKPITRMKEAFRHYGQGDFSAKVEIDHNDEFAELGHVVNDMSEQISNLFEMLKAQEKTRRKMELQTLVYQIDPHFLYNTLDSINAIARSHHDDEVADIVTSLSRLFRLRLHQGREVVTVRDEIAQVDYYLQLQKVRFGDQLSWSMDIEEGILSQRICKFILQPIVENAIFHGIKSRENGGRLRISGRREDARLCFCVEDSGLGMTADELEYIRVRIASTTLPDNGTGFGLWNVNQRIRIYYGDQYGLRISSVVDVGTKVELILKANEE